MHNSGWVRDLTRFLTSAMLAAFLVAGGAYAATSVNLSATGGDRKIDLSWTTTGNLRNVQVMRDTDANASGRQRIAILPGSARSYTDKAVANGTRYWYWIKYTDTSQATGNSNAGSATPVASNPSPQPPPDSGNTGAGCASPTAATLPLVLNGTGEYCRVTSGSISNINSWGAALVEINGVAYTNRWSNQMPARVNGNYTIHYVGKYPWSHLEVNGSGGSNNNGGTPPDPVDTKAAAFGFGHAVTGGAGGERVRVTTTDQLRNALCGSTSGGYCNDSTPRIIEVAATIDFTDSEGSAQGQGCYATQICSAPAKTEATLKYSASDTHCDGKTLFNITYKKAATRGLLVGSNKTLIGVGRAGVIRGKGLLLMGGVSNIIIRNLSFTDIAQGLVFGGDGITVSNASRVWIDHNYFSRIGRQMIVTGTGDQTGVVTDMTVSWNEFDGRNEYSPYCNGKHYWMLLFYGKGNFTFANNWLHDFSGRAPKIDSVANAQVVNNLFESGSGHALDTGANVRVLVEGNDFESVATPVTGTSSHAYALRTSSSSADSACRATLGRACVVNRVNPAGTKDNFAQDTTVLDAMRSASPAIVVPVAPDTVRASVLAGAGVGKL